MKSMLERAIRDCYLKYFTQPLMQSRLYKKKYEDYSCDLPLFLSRKQKICPLEVAKWLQNDLRCLSGVEKVEIQKPGFINFVIDRDIFYEIIIQSILNFSIDKPIQLSSHTNWDNLVYAFIRLKIVFNHLLVQSPSLQPMAYTKQEEYFFDCFDELHWDLNFSSIQTIEKKLQRLAALIHGYFNTITLLCDNHQRYVTQIQVLWLSMIFIEKIFRRFGISCPESI